MWTVCLLCGQRTCLIDGALIALAVSWPYPYVHGAIHTSPARLQVEKNQTLITQMTVREEWWDERLRWSPGDHGGLRLAVIPAKRIWLPDTYIFNKCVLLRQRFTRTIFREFTSTCIN